MVMSFIRTELSNACFHGDLHAVLAWSIKRRMAATCHCGRPPRDLDDCFTAAWLGGHMHILRWLACAYGAELASCIHTASSNGHLGLAQWLYAAHERPRGAPTQQLSPTFCSHGRLEAAPSLHTPWTPTAELFWTVCSNGHLEVAQWLHSFGTVTEEAWLVVAFRLACGFGHLKVAEWLHSLWPVDIHDDADYAFCEAVHKATWSTGARGCKVAQWLLSLDPEYTAWPKKALRRLQSQCWSRARHAWMRSVAMQHR